MFDLATFLTQLYSIVDDFCQAGLPPEPSPGPTPHLSRSEVVTLALLARFRRFASETDFYRFATAHLRPYFPQLPTRAELNRDFRRHRGALVAFFLYLVQELAAADAAYEALDCTAAPVRNGARRGRGWLYGRANHGFSNRLGYFYGFRLLVSVTPTGVITGFGFGPASSKDQPLAETFFAARHAPQRGLESVGKPATAAYLADKGFQGPTTHAHWQRAYHAKVIAPPQNNAKQPWPKGLRRKLASMRQIIETVNDKLVHCFGLEQDRPHTLEGFQARLAARMALHNYCCWLNQHHGRPTLQFADLLAW